MEPVRRAGSAGRQPRKAAQGRPGHADMLAGPEARTESPGAAAAGPTGRARRGYRPRQPSLRSEWIGDG